MKMKNTMMVFFCMVSVFTLKAQKSVQYTSDGKIGFKDASGNIITPAKYEEVINKNEYYQVTSNGKYGIVDKSGQEIIETKYDLLGDFSEHLFPAMENDKGGYIDFSGKVIIPFMYYLPFRFSEGFAVIMSPENKMGVIDKSGKLIIPYKYESLSTCSEGMFLGLLNGKRGFVNKSGTEITPFIYDRGTENFSDGLALVRLDKKYSYIDETGKALPPLFFDDARSFYKGVAIVKSLDKYILIDKKGKTLKEFNYNSIGYQKQDVVNVELENKVGRIDIQTGKEIIPPIYDKIESIEDDFSSWAQLNNKWGLIDKMGKVIVPIQYVYKNRIYKTDNTFVVKKDNKYGLLDAGNRKELTEIKYDSIGRFNDGFAMVKLNNRFGFIDISGKELKQPTMEFVRDFSEGVAIVYNADQWLILEKNGKELPLINNRDPQYENVESFEGGLAKVTSLGKTGYINKSGRVIIPLIYDRGVDLFFNSIAVLLNNKKGVFDYTGNEIIPVLYDELFYGGGIIKAVLDGKEFYFDKNGKPIAKPQEK